MATATRSREPVASDESSGAAPVDDYGPQGRSEWLDIDWREHQRWLRVQGRNLNVIEIGDGPPLIFVHGHSGCWQNWLENIPYFARSHRVIALDLPGFGESEMPADGVSISGYARTLDEVCGQLDVERTALVGNSMGGFVGAELAIKFSTRVERLVLVAAAGMSTKYLGLSSEFFRRRSVIAFARTINLFAEIPDARAETLMCRPRLRWAILSGVLRYPTRLPIPLCREMIRGMGKPAALDAVDAIMSYDFRDSVEDIACPTLVVWGEDDHIVPVKAADEYERLIAPGRKVLFEDTGHCAMVERPARFNRLVDDFLAEPLPD